MESRSTTQKTLIKLLKDAGVYEDGMEVEEMRQLADAMQMSFVETCQQQANELEFLRLQPRDLHSSTLIVTPQVPISADFDAWGSPPSEPIYLTVQAMVHHAMDWSPSENEGRKRSSTDSNPPLSEPRAKRSLRLLSDRDGDEQQEEQPYNPDATPVSVDDSGINYDEVSLSSISETSLVSISAISIGEIPSGHIVSTSSVAVSESSESHEDDSRDQIYD